MGAQSGDFVTVRILTGDVRDRLAGLPDGSVQCVVTSPPYFGLRSYSTEAQVWGGDVACTHEWETRQRIAEVGKGNWAQGTNGRGERQPGGVDAKRSTLIESVVETGWCAKCGAWLGHLGLEPTLAMFIEHLVTVFRDVRRVLRDDGVCWLNLGDSYASSGGVHATGSYDGEVGRHMNGVDRSGRITSGLKPKDLMMVPARVAIALVDDGWWLRKKVVWAKQAPMPESCRDRPTSSHEEIFLLTKRPVYFYDQYGFREDSGANIRDVWTLGPEPFPEAHFAVFPTELPRRCISLGTSEKGQCPACGSPWVRERERLADGKRVERDRGFPGNPQASGGSSWMPVLYADSTWQPSCACNAGEPVPQTVLDPFVGSGTTLLVADQLGRHGIGIELSPEYAEMARRRVYNDAPLFAELVAD